MGEPSTKRTAGSDKEPANQKDEHLRWRSEEGDRRELRHHGAIYPSVLFDKDTVGKLNWKAYYGF